MQGSCYLPYAETAFNYDRQNAKLLVETPWVQLQVDIDHDRVDSIGRILQGIGDSAHVKGDAKTQEFLQFFADMPLVHYLPRALTTDATYQSSASKLLNSSGPADFMKTVNVFDDIDVNRAFS